MCDVRVMNVMKLFEWCKSNENILNKSSFMK